ARLDSSRVVVVALAMDFARSAARVPEIVGVLARAPRWPSEPKLWDPMPETDAALLAFVRARRALLAPAGPRVRTAYVPDAPLPWPEPRDSE
ncbi:MAG: hypothetical protein IT378_00695, partial [Sandaracinaceae bacterium]|nr:hypothetical protein [Sandaracinaceae bacterium]